MTDAIVIGAGPAGLMAADMLSARGYSVLLAEAKTSVGRKFLMAGKSGLNLTKDEPFEDFLAQYGEASDWLRPMLERFSNADVQSWAGDLGQEVFTGSSGRVFPKAMKASPLIRALLGRLAKQGVKTETRWRWTGWQGEQVCFDTPDGPQKITVRATVLALGGASWARLGSDGQWAEILARDGVELAPFQPANAGLLVNWSPHMERHFGTPVKATALIAGGARYRGEFVISGRGLEGGGIYSISHAVREGAPLYLDLLPDLTLAKVTNRLAKPRGKASLANHLRKTLRLDPARIALLQEFARPLPSNVEKLAIQLKNLPVHHSGSRPLDEAISTAGGVMRTAVDDGLMLRNRPGTFCAGEMLDWEAPTGGYLINACLATGRWAGSAAADYLDSP
ncbi:MAG: TIGR03862 family flavoprotein [Alphaproteobacteria bacterium]|nr:TIGR03862 family flavoprotein [Alphaproteobacteria bacterium]